MKTADAIIAIEKQADWWRKKAAQMRAQADVEDMSAQAEAAHEAEQRARFCNRCADELDAVKALLATKAKRMAFVPPSPGEVVSEMQSAGIVLAAEQARLFIAHYESNGWRVGKNPMRSWRSAVVTWRERLREKDPRAVKSPGGGKDSDPGGWREFLVAHGESYIPHVRAPKYLQSEFKK